MKISIKNIRNHYLKIMGISTMVVLMAYGLSLYVNTFHLFSEKLIQFLQAISYIPVGTMLYERLNLRTWSGESPEERYDQAWFNVIGILSIVFTVFTITLRP